MLSGKKFGEGICASKVDDKREIRLFMKTQEKVPEWYGNIGGGTAIDVVFGSGYMWSLAWN